MDCQQSDASVVQSRFGNTLRIISGTGAFSELSPAEKSLRVAPGQVLVGTVTLAAHNGFPSDAVAPLIWTPSWGTHRTSWRLINRWIPVGDSLYVANLNLSAPEGNGTYFIAFAFDGELTGAQVASATNWATRRVVWDDCNDIAQLGAAQIAEAQKCGFTIDNRLFTDGYKLSYLPMDAVYISALTSGAETLAQRGATRLQAQPRRYRVEVPSARPWTDTGVDVSAGQKLSITASGEIYVGALSDPSLDRESPRGTGTVFADGYGCEVSQGANQRMGIPSIAPRLLCWSLIGRIGRDGDIFEVGDSASFTADTEGRLYLGVNDNVFGDNQGSFQAELTVEE
ncbi:MAG: hypothetical protein ACHQZS_06075 [Candidatus Binatales bacterium]